MVFGEDELNQNIIQGNNQNKNMINVSTEKREKIALNLKIKKERNDRNEDTIT